MLLAERLSLYLQLTRLNRPIGIMLLLWPTLWGVWILATALGTAALAAIGKRIALRLVEETAGSLFHHDCQGVPFLKNARHLWVSRMI